MVSNRLQKIFCVGGISGWANTRKKVTTRMLFEISNTNFNELIIY